MAFRRVLPLSFFAAFIPFIAAPVRAQAVPPPARPVASVQSATQQKQRDWKLPLVFERNEGQTPAGVTFAGKTRQYSVALDAKQMRFTLPGTKHPSSVVVSFEGSQAAAPVGLTEAPFRTNYYIGADPSKYRTGIRNYSRVGLSHLYPGIDAEFYASGEAIEHDFIIAPGADAARIGMRLSSGAKASLSSRGDVLIPAQEGELRLQKPVAYQLGSKGEHIAVAAEYVLAGDSSAQELSFRLGKYDHARALVIDPVIVYATYLGGTLGSTASAIAADSAGDVYVTGYTTSPASDFGVTPTNSDLVGAGTTTAAFVAKFTNTDFGSKVTWLTYIGSTSGASQPASIVLQPGSGTSLFIGGTTAATDFPTTAGVFQPTAVGTTTAFIASLAEGSGVVQASTYVDSGITGAPAVTTVAGLAVDNVGDVVAAGSATGSSATLTTADAIPVNPAALASTASKGYILQLNAALATEIFGTYLIGDMPLNTSISSVAYDANGNIYVGGYTLGDFPQAGPYSSATMFQHHANDAGYDSFAAQIIPGSANSPGRTFGYSTWLSGGSLDQLNSIALDASNNLFLFGQTNSVDLIPNTTYTYAGAAAVATPSPGQTATATPVTGIFPTKTNPASTSGFAVKLDPTGQPLVVTYLGGSGNDTVQSGAIDTTGLVYAAGTSSSAQAMTYGSALLLPTPGQDTTVANAGHGFVLQLPSALNAVNYIANIGGSSGTDTVVGVALDQYQNAYVAGTVAADGAYTSDTAFQPASVSTNGSSAAYVAEIATSTTVVPITFLSAVTDTNPIGILAGQTLPIKYTWTFTSNASVPPTDIFLQIPDNPNLKYTGVSITDPQTSLPASICDPVASTPTGAYCYFNTFPSTNGVNDTLTLVLSATLITQPSTPTLSVTVTADGPAGPAGSSTITSNVVLPAQLSITAATSSPANATVFSTNSQASGPNTQVSYAFTVSNAAGAGEAKTASFSLILPTGPGAFQLTKATAVPSGGASIGACDLTGGTGCTSLDLPAGSSVVYTLIGTYPDAALNGGASATATGVFNAAANTFGSNPTYSYAPATTIQRGVHLALTSPTALPAVVNLGPTGSITYTISIANAGPSASSGADTLAFTLPAAFTATATSGLTNCNPQFTSCSIPSIPAGTSASLSLTGNFPDNGANSTILAAAVSETIAAAATLSGDFESGSAASGYSTSASTSVHRTANLVVTASTLAAPATTCAGGNPTCVYMLLSTPNSLDLVPYTFTIQNAGPDIAVGAKVTISLPFAPAFPAGTPHPLASSPLTTGAAAPAFGNALTCTYSGAVTNQIVCGGTATSNLPVAAAALNVTGNLSVDNATVPTTATFVTTSSSLGSIAISESANGAPASPAALPLVEVDRAAHLVTIKTVTLSGTTPASPIHLDENKLSLVPGVNDTFTVTVQVGNAALNAAPSVVVTDTLPLWFRMTQIPAAAANCTVNGVALTANYATQGTPVVMTCALGTLAAGNATASSGNTPASVGTLFQSVAYSGKFQDNGAAADITGNPAANGTPSTKVSQLLVTLQSAVATTAFAVDPFSPRDNTSAQPSISVVRAAHLLLTKTRNTSVATPPAPFADQTDVNLDEKTTATKFGVNDEVEYDVALANSGPNQAIGVQFSDTLPPYFTLVNTYLVSGNPTRPDTGANAIPGSQLAAGSLVCYLGAATNGTPLALPFSTGAAGQPITCTYGSSTAPLALLSGPSTTGNLNNATAIEFVYQGKFQDNAPNADNLPASVSSLSIPSTPVAASVTSSLIVDNGPASDRLSAAFATTIQRAAHLQIFGTPFATRPDGTPLTTLSGVQVIAEAEPSIGGGTPVYNCIRYKVYIQNIGPNIARQPQLTFTSPAGLVLTSTQSGTTTTPGSDAALPSTCVYGTSASGAVTGAAAIPVSELANSSLVIDADAYFGLNTLTAGNSLAGVIASYTALADSGTKDSQKGSFATVNAPAVTVVNTPSGSSFIVSPFSATLTRPATVTFFGTVSAPGITTGTVSITGPALPAGPSPDPRYGTIPLYRTGSGTPNFYTLGTSAFPVSGNTMLCFANPTAGSVLSDTFAKPERVLLWALSGLPAGTPLNPVPHTSSPYTGDITLSISQLGGLSYVEAGGPALPYTAFSNLPTPQSQPIQVCGQVTGFAPSTAPVTVAVLEPVNFSPYITPNTSTPSQTPGKGVSEVSFLFPNTQDYHDYNDSDPCYVANSTSSAPSRQACDDNLVLTTWIFGADGLIPNLPHVIGPLAPVQAAAFLNSTTPYEVQASAVFFELVADQLAVPQYAAKQFCDPGIASASYIPVTTVPACPISAASLAGTPPQEIVFGSAEIAELTPSINGGSAGLIILPPAATPSSSSTAVASGYITAFGSITAGQTVGFQWNLLSIATAGTTYNLSCYMVDAATQITVTPFPTGLSCQAPATFNSNTSTANPAIYIVTTGTLNAQNHTPSWKTVSGGILAALLVPFLMLRRRIAYPRLLALLIALLMLGGTAGLSGCASSINTTSTPTPPATYYFRVSATPAGGAGVLYTAPFYIKVAAGN